MKRRLQIPALILSLALLLTSCSGLEKAGEAPGTLPETLVGLSVMAARSGVTGMPPDSGFVVEAPGNPTAKELSAHLRVEPDMDYSVDRDGEGRYILTPKELLGLETVYRFVLSDSAGAAVHSWAFQTQSVFRVRSTTPAWDSANVALDTGIEFVMTRDDVEMGEHFSIMPPVEGRFLQYGDRSVFVPQKKLAPDTSYTVTLSGDVTAPDGERLGEDYSFSFRTTYQPVKYPPEPESLWFYFENGEAETFQADDVPVFQVQAFREGENQQYQVEAFALSGEEYSRELLRRNEIYYNSSAEEYTPERITGREAAYSFTAPLVRSLNRMAKYGVYRRQGMIFPKTLAPGHYLVQMSAQDSSTGKEIWDQKLIQISDTAVYYTSVEGTGLLWANDGATGNPAQVEVEVELLHPVTGAALLKGTSDSDGLAYLEPGIKPVAQDGGYARSYGLLHLKGQGSGPDYYDFLPLGSFTGETAAQRYISYSRTDRNLYRASDKVHYWGLVRGRREALAPGTEFVLQLEAWGRGYYQWAPQDPVLSTIPVTLEEDGSISAQVPLESLATGSYMLQLREAEGDKRVLQQDQFYVEEFVKQDYQFSTTSDKAFYLPGEKMDATLEASLFDGTPVAGMAFETGDGTHFTDDSGRIRLELEQHDWYHRGSWHPLTQYYFFQSSSQENQEYLVDDSVLYFPSQLILQAELSDDGSKAVVEVSALGTSGLKTREDIYRDFPDSFIGGPVDTQVEVVIKKISFVQSVYKTTSYYDWISRKQREEVWYTYDRVEEEVEQFTRPTVNGRLEVEDLPRDNPEEDSTYTMELTVLDNRGYEVYEELILTPYRDWPRDNWGSSHQALRLSRTRDVTHEKEDVMESPDYWSAAIGEQVEVELAGTMPLSEDGRLLYLLVQDQIVDKRVVEGSGFSLTQSEELLPTARILAAYFDGRHIYSVEGASLHFDSTKQGLTLEVLPDRDEYRPGDAVTLSVQAKDAAGAPAATRLSLGVVDEALYATSHYEQEPRPLGDLYAGCYWPAITEYVSYIQYEYRPGGEGDDEPTDVSDDAGIENVATGGGDSAVPYTRKTFADTAQFVVAETDKTGKAEITFQLPDNITSWRLTGVAVGKDALCAGTSITNIVVTQPLFVQVLAGETYLSGEEVGISVRARGAEVAADTPVRYQAAIRDSKGKVLQTLHRKGRAGSSLPMGFGQLEPGSYTLSVGGNTNDEADLVEYPLTVSEKTPLQAPVTQRLLLGGEGLPEIYPARYPVTIGFADARYSSYMEAAGQMLYSSGDRADKVACALTAKEFMQKYGDKSLQLEFIPENINDFIVQDTTHGGTAIALYSYDSADVEMTAKILALIGDRMTRVEELLPNLERVAAQRSGWEQSKCAALMGLAAMGRPVLLDIQSHVRLLEELEGDSEAMDGDIFAQRAYLATALSLLGDESGAGELYRKRIAPALSDVGTNQRFVELRDSHTSTALALMAASTLGGEDAEKLAEYLLAQPAVHSSANLELAIYLKNFRPGEAADASFQYRKDGKVVTETLGREGVRYISFMKEDLDSGELKTLSGEVVAMVSYTGGVEAIEQGVFAAGNQDLVHLSKDIRPAVAADFKRPHTDQVPAMTAEQLDGLYTTTLTLILDPGAPTGNYEISDRIPSAMRFNTYRSELQMESERLDYSSAYIDHREGQDLTFRFWFQEQYTVEEPVPEPEDIPEPEPAPEPAQPPNVPAEPVPSTLDEPEPDFDDEPEFVDEPESIEDEIDQDEEAVPVNTMLPVVPVSLPVHDDEHTDGEELPKVDEANPGLNPPTEADPEPNPQIGVEGDVPDDWVDVPDHLSADMKEPEIDFAEFDDEPAEQPDIDSELPNMGGSYTSRVLEGPAVLRIHYVSRLLYPASWQGEPPVVHHQDSGIVLLGNGGEGKFTPPPGITKRTWSQAVRSKPEEGQL